VSPDLIFNFNISVNIFEQAKYARLTFYYGGYFGVRLSNFGKKSKMFAVYTPLYSQKFS